MFVTEKLYFKKDGEDMICWSEEKSWEMKIKGIELHGDFVFRADSEAVIITATNSGCKLGVEINNDGCLKLIIQYEGVTAQDVEEVYGGI